MFIKETRKSVTVSKHISKSLRPIPVYDHRTGHRRLVAGNRMNDRTFRKSVYGKSLLCVTILFAILLAFASILTSLTSVHAMTLPPSYEYEYEYEYEAYIPEEADTDYDEHLLSIGPEPDESIALCEYLISYTYMEYVYHEYDNEHIECEYEYSHDEYYPYLPEVYVHISFSEYMFISSYTDNIAISWNFFISRGVSPQATAAIIGTLIKETTTINPLAVNHGDAKDGTASRGIAQWNMGRLSNLQRRPNWDTLYVQLNFMWDEMQSNDINLRFRGRDAVGNPLGMGNMRRKNTTPIEGGFAEFIQMTCIDHAARLFDAVYTRSGDTEQNGRLTRRINHAFGVYERFQYEFYNR